MKPQSKIAPEVWLVLASLIVYAQSLSYSFVYDDIEQIIRNRNAFDAWDLRRIFTSTLVHGVFSYRPLTLWSFALNRWTNQALGLRAVEPVSFHLTNVLLHTLVTCLAYRLFRRVRISEGKSLGAALLFAVMPVHVEAVTGVVGRAELIAAFFGLLFLLGHLSNWPILVNGLLYACSILGKESGITFLGVTVASDLLIRREHTESGLKRGLRFSFYALVAVAWYRWRGYVYALDFNDWANRKTARTLETPTLALTAVKRLLSAGAYQAEYLKRIIFPFHLASDSSLNENPIARSLYDGRFLLFVAVVLVSLYWVWRRRKSDSAIPFFWSFYFVTFAVTSNFLVPVSAAVGERLAYTPSLAICALLTLAIFQKRSFFLSGIFVGCFLFYACRTVIRNPVWKNEMTFFAAQVSDSPNSAKAHYNYARVLLKYGREEEAVSELNRAIAIYPKYSEAIIHLTEILLRRSSTPPKTASRDTAG